MERVDGKFSILVPDGKHIRPSIEGLLAARGFDTELWQNGRLHADIKNAPATLTYQNHADVIGEVEDGISHAGFVGSDRYAEYVANLKPGELPAVGVLAKFELFNPNIRLSLLVRDNPQDNPMFQEVEDLVASGIVTTYPGVVREYLASVLPEINPASEFFPKIYGRVSGKEEGHVDSRRFDAAGVIVDTGTAMRANNLRELTVMMTGVQPVLAYNIEYFKDRANRRRLDEFNDMLFEGRRPALSARSLPVIVRAGILPSQESYRGPVVHTTMGGASRMVAAATADLPFTTNRV